MAVGPISFNSIQYQLPQMNPYLSGQAAGQELARGNEKSFAFPQEMQKGNLLNQILAAQARNAPQMNQEELKKAQLANQLSSIQNQYAPQMTQAELAYKQAQTPNLQANTALMGQQAQYFGPNIQSEIGSRNAQAALNRMYVDKPAYLAGGDTAQVQVLADMLKNNPTQLNDLQKHRDNPVVNSILNQIQNKGFIGGGGTGGGVGAKEQMLLNQLVAKDNPHLNNDPDRVYEASNVIASGGNALADGTKVNVSPAARASLDRITKYGSTGSLITQGIKAQQADAELNVLSNLAGQYVKPYSDTYFGYSPQQMLDSVKNDEGSQKKLGKFIAGQAIQFELAQIRNRIAQGEPSVSATQELMGRSGQVIDTRYPKLSAIAREEARKTLDEALQQGLKARQSIGINPSSLNRMPLPQNAQQINNLAQKYNELPGNPSLTIKAPSSQNGKVLVSDSKGSKFWLPESQLSEALQNGYKRM